MGREGDAEEWEGTQRPMGATVVVIVVTSVLLSAPAGQALASHHHICPTHKNIVKLFPYETAFFGTNNLIVSVKVEAAGCVNDTRVLSLLEFTSSNEASLSGKNLKWYEFSFISCGNYVAKIGSEIVKFNPEMLSRKCINKPITLSVEPNVKLGKNCTGSSLGREIEQSKAACKALVEGVPDTGHHLKKPARSSIEKLFDLLDKRKSYDTSNLFFGDQQDPVAPAVDGNDDKNIFDTPGLFFGGQQEPKEPEVDKSEIFRNWQKNNYEDILQATPASQPTYNEDDNSYFDKDADFSKRRKYKENSIPIFIGIVAFTVSMCLRFCLCRGKNVVQRVTTVTVIRGRPVGSPDVPQDHQQDPPPSYIDVVNEATSPQSPAGDGSAEPPPPAYADIVDEVLPPTYSEVEAQSMPASEEAPLADQEAEATQPPPDPESVQDSKSSAPSKNILSKYRSHQKQFAFKVLEEDE